MPRFRGLYNDFVVAKALINEEQMTFKINRWFLMKKCNKKPTNFDKHIDNER